MLKALFVRIAVTSLLFLAAQAALQAAEEGLVAHYTFDEGSGVTATDLSGNRLSGKVSGATYVKSPRGYALHFDGKAGSVDCGGNPSLNLAGDLTIEAWLRATATDARNRLIVGDTASLAVDRNYSLRFDQNNLIFEHGNDKECEQIVLTQGSAFTGAWQHLALICEFPRYYFYLDGKEVKQGELTLPISKTTGGNRFIGGWWAGLFQGDIDEVRIYNRALPERLVLGHLAGKDVSVPLRLLVEPALHYSRQILGVNLLATNLADDNVTARIRLLQLRRDKPLADQSARIKETRPASERGGAQVSFDMRHLAPGSYQIQVAVKDNDGASVAAAASEIVIPQKPRWFGSRAGTSDKVLSPYTALKVERNDVHLTVCIWGRRFTFGSSPFFSRMESKGASMLSAPMRLLGKANGKGFDFQCGPAKVVAVKASKGSFSQSGIVEAIQFSVHTDIEYDGMAKVDWSVKANRPTSLEELAIEIPLDSRYARYLYTWPMETASHSGALQHDMSFPFKPILWLGDEEKGLSWFAESDQNWFLQDDKQAIQILRKNGAVVLRLNLVSKPVELKQGESLAYTFDLQATPVKPIEKDCWDYRIVECPWYGKDFDMLTKTIDGKPALAAFVDKGVKTLLIFNPWTDVFGYYEPIGHAEEFKKLVKAAHAQGLKAIPYFSFLISELAPEYPFLKNEVTTRPVQIFTWPEGHPAIAKRQVANVVCLKGVWQDALVDGIARLIDEYDIDGVYLDSTVLPFACANQEHGCGYVSRNSRGAVTRTFPLFAVRETVKRIYTVIKERKPDGIVDAHVYDAMNIPALAFTTDYFIGEQLSRPASGFLPSALPLDRFRTEMMGRNWGVPAELMSYMWGDYAKCYGEALLHDVPIRSETEEELKLASSVWRLFEDFGRKEARWLPYWENMDCATITPANCYVSLYQHPENGILAVVANLGEKDAEATLQLNAQKLGMSGRITAVDGLSRAPLPVQENRMVLPLRSQEWKTIWVKARPG